MKPEPTGRSIPHEARLVELAREGDKSAYRALVEGYQDRLFGLVLSMVGQREQAEDLTQEIFVKAYFGLSSFEGQSGFYTWLYRIASNHCLDYFRKRRLDAISLDQPVTADSDLTVQDTLEGPAAYRPESPLEAHSAAAALLGALEPDQRLILTLRELEGHSYEEIAEMLDCPVNTVKSRLNRAREALKDAYTNLYGPLRADQAPEGNIPNSKIVLESREKL